MAEHVRRRAYINRSRRRSPPPAQDTRRARCVGRETFFQ